jgi:NAD(P)H-nitrite reductase large subunit
MASVLATSNPAQAAEAIVCRCLQVTETALVEAIERHDLQTLAEVKRHTGAGDGCTACHCTLKEYLLARRAEQAAVLTFATADSSASRRAG